ncbi:hypothetical protein CRM22_010516 [Opisthorchis felineus]|nr:hypothetical protein CRM22_010516 [Opisthorchis felineus]
MQNGITETSLDIPDLLKLTGESSFSQENWSSADSEDEPAKDDEQSQCPVCQISKDDGRILCTHASGRSGSWKTCEELLKKLHTHLHLVSMDNLVLQSELEVLRRAFSSKCEAVEILKRQAYKPSGDRPSNLDAFQGALAAKDELARVQTEMAILEGKLQANQLAWETKSKTLMEVNARLTKQLESTQLKMKELLQENVYLLYKHDKLGHLGFKAPSNSKVETEKSPNSCPPTDVSFSRSTVESSRSSLRHLLITSEAFLASLETNGRSSASCSITSNNQFAEQRTSLNGSELPPSVRLTPTPSMNKTSSTLEQGIQCDLSSFGSSLSLQSTSSVTANCSCSSTSQSLCACAIESIRLQRKLLRCSHQLYKEANSVRDMKITIEAYRIALESQFKKNRSVFKAMAALIPHVPKITYANSPLFTSLVHDLLGMNSSCDTPAPWHSPLPSPAEALHRILVWFYQNMNRIVTHLSTCNNPPTRCASIEEHHSPEDSLLCIDNLDLRRKRGIRAHSFHESSSDSLPSTLRSSSIRKSLRQITLGTQRQIESYHARLQNARSMIELPTGPDGKSSVDAFQVPPISLSESRSSDFYRKKKPGSSNMSYAAKLCARARSMEALHSTAATGGSAVRLRYQSNSSILGELASKTNELAELLLDQRLISHISRKTM